MTKRINAKKKASRSLNVSLWGRANDPFNKRNFRGNIIENLTIIKYSEVLKNRWKKYANKYDYAKNIEFDEIIKCLENIISIIKPIFV